MATEVLEYTDDEGLITVGSPLQTASTGTATTRRGTDGKLKPPAVAQFWGHTATADAYQDYTDEMRPGDWDVCLLDGVALPGLAQVRGEGFEQRIHKVKSPGRHGATHRYLGNANVDFEVTVLLWTEEHLQRFAKLVSLLTTAPPPQTRRVKQKQVVGYSAVGTDGVSGMTESRTIETTVVETLASSGPRTIDVYHPALALFGIRTATVMKVTLPAPVPGHDYYSATLRLSQLRLGKRSSGVGAKTAAQATTSSGAVIATTNVPSASLTGP